ncbi:MAG: M20/M25/M40 family metallo-hydrolase [Clostridia bacterium]|nr:M20/M25/M40 family metallo-hydrolase [Clostridia bacterium]
MQKLFDKVDALENEYIDFLVDICSIESPSAYKKGVDEVGEYICEKARKLGWKIEIQKQEISGDCICITMNDEIDEKPIAFSGHMDTVHPVGLFGNPPVKKDGDKIYGPGIVDCKGGIAAAFLAMRALHECGFKGRPVKLILQSDEEVSSASSNKTTVSYMAEKAKDCIGFLNCEGYSEGNVTVKRKGINKYLFEVTGKAAHAGVCYSGLSAIAEAAQKILELEKYKEPEGITFNCGTISGGTVPNTVPEKCNFTVDIRFSTNEEMEKADKIVEEISKKSFLEGTTCKTTLLSHRVPMEIKKENLELLEKINEIFIKNNMMPLKQNASNGGSDASDISAYGIPCLDSLGVRGGAIHNKGEFVYTKSIAESAKRLSIIAYCI